MTALVLENLAMLPAQVQSLRVYLMRFARALDALVSARAARAVPEWRMRQVRSEINRYQSLIRASEIWHEKQAKDAPAPNDVTCFALPESAICNFSR